MSKTVTIELAGPRKPIEVRVPDDMTVATAREQLLMSGQITAEDLGEPSGDPALETGPVGAGLVTAGEFVSSIPTRLNAIFGNEFLRAESLEELQGREQQLETLRAEEPVGAFLGSIAPGFAIPGGLPAQAIGGFALGALENPESPVLGGAVSGVLGVGGAFGADKLASRIGARRLARSGSATKAQRGRMRQFAADAGIPLTIAERTTGRVAQFFDRQASTVLGRSVKGPTKQKALNKAMAKGIGVDSDLLTGDVLNTAARKFGNVFEDVARNVEEIPITQEFDTAIQGLGELAEEIVPNARSMKALETLENIVTGGKGLTGKQYNRLRSQFGKFSRNEWKAGGDQVSGEFLDSIIDVMDNALAQSSPDAAAALGPARQGWKLLSAYRRGAALDPFGNVNPVSMARSLENSYPGLDLNRFAGGPVGAAQKANLAATAFPAFRSSGTAERGIMANIGGLGVGLAELMLGGGTPALVGGALARIPGPIVTQAIEGTASGLANFVSGVDDDADTN